MLSLAQCSFRFPSWTSVRYRLATPRSIRCRSNRPRSISTCHTYRKRQRVYSIGSRGDSDDSDDVDIDRLAEQLSNAASNRRSRHRSPFVHRPEDFAAEEFEVVQTLGYLSIKITRPQGSGEDKLSGPVASNNAAVVAFVANYISGRPYQYPVYTLLKEYLPAAKSIAENEFRALTHLAPISEYKWEAASASVRHELPIVQLLGYFRGGPRDETLDEESERSLWFVYKWEGMKPLSSYFSAPQSTPGAIWPWARSKKQEIKARHKMIRCIFRGVMQAVTFCHEKGVVHGSLGTGSVLMSTFDDYSAESLVVILDNFGFASRIQPIPRVGNEGLFAPTESIQAVQNELRIMGMLFLETVIMALSDNKDTATQPFLERLVMEIFRDDVDGLKEYIMNEPSWVDCVEFLEEKNGAGWKLLQRLLGGTATSASSLHSFLE